MFVCLMSHLSLSWAGQTKTKPFTVLVVGDSLSAAYQIPIESGWVSQLKKRLSLNYPNIEVFNLSVSGATTSNGLGMLEQGLTKDGVCLTILELGANDGLRGLAPAHIQRNLNQMVDMAIEHKSQVLVLGMKLPFNYGKDYRDAFEGVFSSLTQDPRVTLVPFFLDPVHNQPELMQADRLHPNEKAQSVLLDYIWPDLLPLLSACITSRFQNNP